jgi:hypothetical protein
MTTKDEALKMAKDVIKYNDLHHFDEDALKAIKAIDEALATNEESSLVQPAQEPVAWMKNALDNARDVCKYLDHDMIKEAKAHTKFFWNDLDKIRDFDDTHPAPSWQKLSDDEIVSIWEDGTIRMNPFARAIEQALKNKNANA